MNAKIASAVFGIVFLLVGFLGFTSNPIISEHDAIFHTDAIHNTVHIVSGALFLIIGFNWPHFAPTFLKFFGVVYFLLGLLGLATFGTDGMGELLGFLHVNGADNFLHIALGIIIFAGGMLNGSIKTAGKT